jgi:hypothetical protein
MSCTNHVAKPPRQRAGNETTLNTGIRGIFDTRRKVRFFYGSFRRQRNYTEQTNDWEKALKIQKRRLAKQKREDPRGQLCVCVCVPVDTHACPQKRSNSTDTERGQGNCSAQASKTKIASNYPDKKGTFVRKCITQSHACNN